MSAPSRCNRSCTLWEITTPEETADVLLECHGDTAVIEALWQIWLRAGDDPEDIRFWRSVLLILGEDDLVHAHFTPKLAAMLVNERADDPPRTVWAYLREAAFERDHRRWSFWFEVMAIVVAGDSRVPVPGCEILVSPGDYYHEP